MLTADEFPQNLPNMADMAPEFNHFDIYGAGNPCPSVPSICDILPENKFTKILSVKRERLENEIKTLISTLEERSEKLQEAMAIREQEILSQNPIHESTLVTGKQIQKLEYELAQIRSEACEINPAEGANIKPFCCKVEIKKVIKLQRKVDKLQNLALLKACDLKLLDEAKNRMKIDISNLNDDIKSASKIIDDYEKELQDISRDIRKVINSEYTQKPAEERIEEDIPFSQGLSDWSIDDLPPEGKKTPRLPHKGQSPSRHPPKEQPPSKDGRRICPKKPSKPLEVKPKPPVRRCPPTQVPKKRVVPVRPPEKQIPKKRSPEKPPLPKPPCKRNDANKTPKKTPSPRYPDKIDPMKPKQPDTPKQCPEKSEIPPPKNPRLPPVEFPPQPFNPNESQIEPAEVEDDEESSSSSYLKELYESTPHASSENILHIRKTADVSGSMVNPNCIKHADSLSISHGGSGDTTDCHTESINAEAAVEYAEESSGHKLDSTGSEIIQLEENNIESGNTDNSDKNANVSLQTQEIFGTEVKSGNDICGIYSHPGTAVDYLSEVTTKQDHEKAHETSDESKVSALTIRCYCECASRNHATESMTNFVEKVDENDSVVVEDSSSLAPQSHLYHTNTINDTNSRNGIGQNSSQHATNVDGAKFACKRSKHLPPSTTSELETDEQSSKTTSLDVKEFNDKSDDPDDTAPNATRKNNSRENDDQRYQQYTNSPRNQNSTESPRGSKEQQPSSQKKASNHHNTIREAESRPHKGRENDRPTIAHEKHKPRIASNQLKFEKVSKKRSLCSFANKTLEKSNTVLLNINSTNNRRASTQSSHYVRVQRPTRTKQTQTSMDSARNTTKKYKKEGEAVTKVKEIAQKENRMTRNSPIMRIPRDKHRISNNCGAGYDSTNAQSQAKYLEEKLQHYRHLYSVLKEENRDLSKQFIASQIDLGKYKENYEKLQLDTRKAENLTDEIVKLRQTNTELEKQITEIVSQLNRKELENQSLVIENERFQSECGVKLATTGSTVENINFIQKISQLEQRVQYLSDQNQTTLRSYEESQKLLEQAEQKLDAISEELRKSSKDTCVLAQPSGDATHKDWLNYSRIMTERFDESKHKLDTSIFLLTITEEERDELKKENSEIKSMLQKSENKINQLLTDRNSPSLQSQVAFLSEEFEKQATLTKQFEEQVKQLSKQKLEISEKLKKADLKLEDYRETLDSLRTYKEGIMKIRSSDRVQYTDHTKKGPSDSINNDEVATTKTKSSMNPKSYTSKALSSVLKRYCKGLPRIASSRHESSYSRSKSVNASTMVTKRDKEPTELALVYSFLHQQISENLRKIRNKSESKSIRQELNDIRHSLEWSRRKVQDITNQNQTTKKMPVAIDNPSSSLLGNIFEKIMVQGTSSLNPKEILYLHRVVYKAGVECSKNSKKSRTIRAAGSFNNEKEIDSQSDISLTK